MEVRNRYANRSKILERKFHQIIRYLSVGLDPFQITKFVALKRNSVNR